MSDRQPQFISRQHLLALAFFSCFLFFLYQMLRLLAPFASALLLAAILSLALYPLHVRLTSLVKGRQSLAAAIMTLAVVLVIIGPAISVLCVLTTQAIDVYQGIAENMRSGRLPDSWSQVADGISRWAAEYPALSGIDVKGELLKFLGDLTTGLASQIGVLLKNSLILGIDVAVMLIALYFFFRNGETYYRSFLSMLPFSHEHKQALARKVHDTFTAVINGVFLIALVQGTATGIGFAVFGLSFPVFWGFLAAVLALLPIGGAALVWAPGALFLFTKGAVLKSVLLVCWGIVLVTMPDNILKPLLIGRKAKINPFFLFIGILGGLNVYGVFGILLGPIVVTMLAAFIQIYREEYGE